MSQRPMTREQLAVLADDIADMAQEFIDARDAKSLRNMARNLAGMIREHSRRVGSPAAMYNSESAAQRLIEQERAAMARAQAAETLKAAGAGAASFAQAGASPGVAPGVAGFVTVDRKVCFIRCAFAAAWGFPACRP